MRHRFAKFNDNNCPICRFAEFNNDNCPICEEGQSPEKYLCRWRIESDGVYVSHFSPFHARHHFTIYGHWKEEDDHYEFLLE